MAQLEVLSAERRRRWSRSEKERLVAASFEPGVSASAVARSAGIHVSQLFRWRKQLCERVVPAASTTMVPVVIAEPSGPAAAAPTKPRRTREAADDAVQLAERPGRSRPGKSVRTIHTPPSTNMRLRSQSGRAV